LTSPAASPDPIRMAHSVQEAQTKGGRQLLGDHIGSADVVARLARANEHAKGANISATKTGMHLLQEETG
jgi:hypothetical protein